MGRIAGIRIVSTNTMLMLTGKSETVAMQDYPDNSTWLYKINLQTGKGDLLSAIPGYYPVSMTFTDANAGWMVLNKIIPQGNVYSNRNTYITRTTDGGVTWSTPLLVDPAEPLMLAAGNAGNLFLYNGNGGGYFSTDGGRTWKKSKSNERFNNVVIMNTGLLYAVGEQGFIKSEDSGENWSPVSQYSYGKLYFFNEKQGLRYVDNRLYLTDDGGVSWKTLLYPFPYIVN